jgi:hypothetical protein
MSQESVSNITGNVELTCIVPYGRADDWSRRSTVRASAHVPSQFLVPEYVAIADY